MQELESSPALTAAPSSSTPIGGGGGGESMDKSAISMSTVDTKPFYADYGHSYYDNNTDASKSAAAAIAAAAMYYTQQTSQAQPPTSVPFSSSYDYQAQHQPLPQQHHIQQQQPELVTTTRPVLNWHLTPPSSSSSKNSSPSTSNTSSLGDYFEYYSAGGGYQLENGTGSVQTSTIGGEISASKSIFSTICSNEGNFLFSSNAHKSSVNCHAYNYPSSSSSYHHHHPHHYAAQQPGIATTVQFGSCKSEPDVERKSSDDDSSSLKIDAKSSQLASASSSSSLYLSSPTSIHSKMASTMGTTASDVVTASHPAIVNQLQKHQNMSISSTSTPTSSSGLSSLSLSVNSESKSAPLSQCYDWMKPGKSQSNGKTRTKDKYRIVYTDYQRKELEKEFSLNSKYITIKRKAELSTQLLLSERQIKIWFQNRRAKDRKMSRKQKLDNNVSSTTKNDHLSGGKHLNSDYSIDDEDDDDDELDECDDQTDMNLHQIREQLRGDNTSSEEIKMDAPISSASSLSVSSASNTSPLIDPAKPSGKSKAKKSRSSAKNFVKSEQQSSPQETSCSAEPTSFVTAEAFHNSMHHASYAAYHPYSMLSASMEQTQAAQTAPIGQFYSSYGQAPVQPTAGSLYPGSVYQHQTFGFGQPDYNSSLYHQHAATSDYMSQQSHHQQPAQVTTSSATGAPSYFTNDYLASKSFMSQLTGKSSFPSTSGGVSCMSLPHSPAAAAAAAAAATSQSILVANVLSQFQSV